MDRSQLAGCQRRGYRQHQAVGPQCQRPALRLPWLILGFCMRRGLAEQRHALAQLGFGAGQLARPQMHSSTARRVQDLRRRQAGFFARQTAPQQGTRALSSASLLRVRLACLCTERPTCSSALKFVSCPSQCTAPFTSPSARAMLARRKWKCDLHRARCSLQGQGVAPTSAACAQLGLCR
jgi:hypothetical protein